MKTKLKKMFIMKEYIIQTVCDHFQVSREDIMSMGKATGEINKARQLCYFLLWKWAGIGKVYIGRMFRRDHTTIIAGIQNVTKSIGVKTWIYQDFLILDLKCEEYSEIHQAA